MEFYRSIHQLYDYIFPLNQLQINFIQEQCPPFNTQILDIGCSTGQLAIELAKLGYKVNAIDMDESMISMAESKSVQNNLVFKVANMLEISDHYPTDTFDAVVCFGNTLVHLPGKQEVQKLLNGVYSILKTGGQMLIQILNYDYILGEKITELPVIENQHIKFTRKYQFQLNGSINFITRLLVKEINQEINNEITLWPITKHELEGMLQTSGFSIIEFSSSFNNDPFSSSSLPLIVKARK